MKSFLDVIIVKKKTFQYFKSSSRLWISNLKLSQLAMTYSKLTIDTLEQGMKYVQS